MTTRPGDTGLTTATAAERPGRARVLPATVALPILLMLVIVATAVSYNAPLTIRLAPNDETRQVFFGFHGVERADDSLFRWTNGSGRICIEQVGRVARAVLGVRILGEGANALGRTAVSFSVNGQPLVTAPIQGATRVYHMHVGGALAADDNACIGITSEAAAIPSDVRTLGVPFAGLALTPLTSSTPTLPALGQLGLNLVVAALAHWLLCRLGVSAWVAALGVATVAVAIVAAILTGQITPGLGQARHMLPLAAGLAIVAAQVAILGATRAWRSSLSLLARDLLAMLFWSLTLVGLKELFQQLLGFGGVWPLKAGFFPNYTAFALIPAALFVGWAWLVLRRLERVNHTYPASSAALVILGALLLAPAVKAGTRGWESLFLTFTNNPFDYIADVPKVGDDPLGFLRNFVQIKDELALHSSTHPPGSILLLWAVERAFGPGPVATSWAAIALSALAPLAGLWLGYRLGGPRLGLLAGAIAAVMPGQLVYGATSMDGVFNMLLALGAAAFLLALERPARPAAAALAGLLIAVGLFFTYAATQLFFFGIAVSAVAVARGWNTTTGDGLPRLRAAAAPALRQGLIAAGVIVLLYAGLFLATGFNVAEGAFRATAINAEVMRLVSERPFVPPSIAYYTLYLVANLLAFGWYLGPWGLTATTGAGGAALRRRPMDGLGALAAGLAALVAGMTLSGLFNREVERIWGFTYPLLAVLIARHALQGDGREQRWRAALYLSLAFAHGLLTRLLLSAGW